MSSDSATLAQILAKLNKLDVVENKIDALDRKFGELSSAVTTLQTTVGGHTDQIAEIRQELAASRAEVKHLKYSHNIREQRSRACTIRVFNFMYIVGESLDNHKALSARVYDRVVRPALVAAKAGGDLAILPQQQNAIESCFRIVPRGEGQSPSSAPPPVIVKLVNNNIKFAVMKYRKHVLPPTKEEKSAGCRRYTLVEDLTPDAHRLLKAMQADARTDKVWSVNGLIHYSLPGVSGYRKVRNIYDSLDDILGNRE